MFKKHTNSQPQGESGVWQKKVKPRLEEIENLRARGATMQQISEVLVVGGGVLSRLKSKHPELARALSIASAAREEHLVGRMWELADGKATRFEKIEIKDENGKIKGSQEKTIKLEPQLSAQHALLKRFHGWSDNPKVDDAVANTLNNKDWTAKLSLIPGFSDLSPKSSEADNFSAEPTSSAEADDGAVIPKPTESALPLSRGSDVRLHQAKQTPEASEACAQANASGAGGVAGENIAEKEGDDDDYRE